MQLVIDIVGKSVKAGKRQKWEVTKANKPKRGYLKFILSVYGIPHKYSSIFF